MNAQKHVILFNGPPRSGKDTAADFAMEWIEFNYPIKAHRYSVARPLKEATHALFGLNVPVDEYEDRKTTPLPEFFGATPRQSYIDLSEKCVKPFYGLDFFSKVAVQYISRLPENVIVVSDCGFRAEIDGLIEKFGRDNIKLVRVHREGEDYAKYNDSRSELFIDEDDHDLFNNGTLDEFRDATVYLIEKFIKQWGLV